MSGLAYDGEKYISIFGPIMYGLLVGVFPVLECQDCFSEVAFHIWAVGGDLGWITSKNLR